MTESDRTSQILRPMVDYLRARELMRRGQAEESAGALEGIFGAQQPNPFLRQNLAMALDERTAGGSVLLDGIYGEMKWIQRQSAEPRKSHS